MSIKKTKKRKNNMIIKCQNNKIECYISEELDMEYILEKISDYQSHVWRTSQDLYEYRILSTVHQYIYDNYCNDILYFITDVDKTKVKIGRTSNLEYRLNQLKKSTPFEIEVHNFIINAGNYEHLLHRKFKSENIGFNRKFDGFTEWFNINNDIKKLLKSKSRDDIKKNLTSEKQRK